MIGEREREREFFLASGEPTEDGVYLHCSWL